MNKLESRGLAMQMHCNPDKRSCGIFLSETSATLLKELRVAAQSNQDATAMLSAEGRRQLMGLLCKIHR